ncbi:hypothetical protein BJX66DRAFT_344285 [Aspergillus keveii]|uniref:Myb-like domain-containing protein n=1 Tax=Aspergillus keveii TaxID=714993 RepID=A0ABR4FLU2_9EURO
MPGKDHWTEAEKDRLLRLREQYSHLPWAQFHKLKKFPGRSDMAVYLQWKRSHCPEVAPKAEPAPTPAVTDSSASTSFDTSLPATSSAADSDTTWKPRMRLSPREFSPMTQITTRLQGLGPRRSKRYRLTDSDGEEDGGSSADNDDFEYRRTKSKVADKRRDQGNKLFSHTRAEERSKGSDSESSGKGPGVRDQTRETVTKPNLIPLQSKTTRRIFNYSSEDVGTPTPTFITSKREPTSLWCKNWNNTEQTILAETDTEDEGEAGMSPSAAGQIARELNQELPTRETGRAQTPARSSFKIPAPNRPGGHRYRSATVSSATMRATSLLSTVSQEDDITPRGRFLGTAHHVAPIGQSSWAAVEGIYNGERTAQVEMNAYSHKATSMTPYVTHSTSVIPSCESPLTTTQAAATTTENCYATTHYSPLNCDPDPSCTARSSVCEAFEKTLALTAVERSQQEDEARSCREQIEELQKKVLTKEEGAKALKKKEDILKMLAERSASNSRMSEHESARFWLSLDPSDQQLALEALNSIIPESDCDNTPMDMDDE